MKKSSRRPRPKSLKQSKKAETLKENKLKNTVTRSNSKDGKIQNQQNDSLDEENEQTLVKIGKIPYKWYEDFKHFGYDNKLNKVQKEAAKNTIEQFIEKSQNKSWWRTIRDELNAKDIRLTDAQLSLIERIRSGKMASSTIATTEYKIEHPYDDPFPVHSHPPAKRNFMPSKWEQMKVNKILDGLLSGRIPWNQPSVSQQDEIYDAWASEIPSERGVINIAPAKAKLPSHAQSYNPPKQYILSTEEQKEWEEMHEDDKPFDVLPTAYKAMRHIPFYQKLINERFERCLDLYLCPRVKKRKLNIDPDSLIPQLPDSSSMKPFPTAQTINYQGHSCTVLSIAVSPNGEYFTTGDASGLHIVWSTLSSRILFSKQYTASIFSLSWSVNNCIAVAHGCQVQIMIWKYPKLFTAAVQQTIQSIVSTKWRIYEPQCNQYAQGLRINISFQCDVTHLKFQPSKGDYFVTVCPHHIQKNKVISIHRLSKGASETGFIKGSSMFKSVFFYPKKPQIVVLTGTRIQIFNLQQMSLFKKMSGGVNNYSCLSVHPEGDYILAGTDGCKLLCFDLDYGDKPFKSMQYHQKPLMDIAFHNKYPLMASCSSDSTIHVFHFKPNPLNEATIVPLKILKGHHNGQTITKIAFHPHQPWLFSIATDNKVLCWT